MMQMSVPPESTTLPQQSPPQEPLPPTPSTAQRETSALVSGFPSWWLPQLVATPFSGYPSTAIDWEGLLRHGLALQRHHPTQTPAGMSDTGLDSLEPPPLSIPTVQSPLGMPAVPWGGPPQAFSTIHCTNFHLSCCKVTPPSPTPTGVGCKCINTKK